MNHRAHEGHTRFSVTIGLLALFWSLLGQSGQVLADTWATPGTTWTWQLTGTIDTEVDAQVYEIDLFDAPQTVIDTLHAKGRKVICYFSAGSWEDWRPDAKKFRASIKGKRLKEWAGEKWLDIRKVRKLRRVMQARMDLAAAKGCDAVETDNVDGYQNDTGFRLKKSQQLRYNKRLAKWAHQRGMLIGLKNDLGQIPKLVDFFDFAVNEECFAYDECDALLAFSQPEGNKPRKAVFGAEYEGDPVEFCPMANRMGFSTLQLPLGLDGSSRVDCLKSYPY